jgi:hypothetical protein
LPADLSFVLFASPIPVSENGTFQIEGLTPKRFHVNVLGAFGRNYVKSMRSGGRELVDQILDLGGGSAQLEIVVSTKLAKLSGTVDRVHQQALPGFIALERIGSPNGVTGQSLTYGVGETGAFDAGSIAPGDYRVFAFEELDLIYLRDPNFLKKFASRSIELKIAEGETKTISLKQIPFPEIDAATKEQ